ncbi:diaminopimelate epimerase [Halobacillus sp. BBL2006]|uniref:diaminopimelate epimerase n=1 Tax=Halobacillus sp. BBL2006 TaxID=1543706 RepID=UPI000543CC36|nr:diaminopimelate epimerase [Halobacillus sp. BBL2006]KHE70678.1 diaminopimelate epimerase [Halobacillus sp. BBL2006]
MQIEFIKCHGSGNDFIMIDEMTKNYSFTEQQRKDLSILLCNRQEGIGSDGILFVMPSEKAEARMRMFNSDGTEAEMCGNGLRCVARYVIEKLRKTEVAIETEKAVLASSQVAEIYPGIDTFSVAIEPVSFEASSLPMTVKEEQVVDQVIPELSNERTFTALSVPNPHIISIMDEVLQDELLHVGKKANNLPAVFPKGVNVSFVKILEKNKIFVQTYERGVGLTNACGTAMSASSLVSTMLGPNELDTPIVVINKGGLVNCVVKKTDERYSIQLRGNGTYVYKSVVDVNFDDKEFQVHEKTFFNEENEKYQQLEGYALSQIGGESS